LFTIVFALAAGSECFGYGSIACGNLNNLIYCRGFTDVPSFAEADAHAMELCKNTAQSRNECNVILRFNNECNSIAIAPVPNSSLVIGRGNDTQAAIADALATCRNKYSVPYCQIATTSCDSYTIAVAPPPPPQQRPRQPDLNQATPVRANDIEKEDHRFDFLSDPAFYRALVLAKLFQDIWTGIGLGLGILFVIVVYAKRAAIVNFVIHGNLPYKIETRSQDIEILFVRSQRSNWYGRAIFGFTAQMGMSDHQLLLVRRYWLGRVIAFDSLRRRRQNELARLHLQLAAQAESKPKDDKPLSQFLSFFRTLFFCLFWLLRSLISFLIGFLFIRVNVAKLVRGRLVESADLTLLMEAKAAIEETSRYLKEYLQLAETFDNREEVYEPPA